ncbi:MAG: serine/threonine protein kinase, partial [Gemmataceae bacterium]|nr:serine/threonine protein kinase [Gemmataceae bacterium]
DRSRVEQAAQAIVRARVQGQTADLLELLVREGLLQPAHAQELRLSLASTQYDPSSPINGKRDRKTTEPAAPADLSLPGEGEAPRYLGGYRLLRRLGEGGMGAVYLGYREGEDRKVAIKVLSDHLADNQPSVDRFYREARSGASLNHPNIVHNLAVGQDNTSGKYYLVLEYVDGPSAHALLDRFGRLKVGDAIHIILDIARALEHAHSRNIIHRDIKPDNILITTSGVAKLSDLGLAKRTDETSHLTATRQGFGTPYYMPYEQAMNAKYADGRSDIYALGATLYHLIAGQVPFAGINHLEILDKKNLGFFEPASSVNPDVPQALDQILEKMLARDPQDRYQTASELIVDLERANLSAPMPSFVDAELALQDPLVRERLASAAPPTCPDLSARPLAPSAVESNDPDVWFLRYRDRHGKLCKAKATTRQVLQRLREGKLPREVEAAHQPQGEYQPLRTYSAFRDVTRARRKSPERNGPAVEQPSSAPGAVMVRSRWWLLIGLGLALAAAGAVVLVNLFGPG